MTDRRYEPGISHDRRRTHLHCERPRLLNVLAGSVLAAALLVGGVQPAAQATTAPSLATFIVTYDAPPGADDLDVLRGLATGVHGFAHLPAAVAVINPLDVALLRRMPGVRGVWTNETYRPLMAQSTSYLGADRVWADFGVTGAGVSVAVIDAGVDGTHPDLCARAEFCVGTPVKTVQNVKILGRQELADPVVVVEDLVTTDSGSGHGSHVAGIVAGAGSASEVSGTYRGVAPGASIVGYGTGDVVEAQNVLAAYDHAIEHRDRYNIRAINNSWGPGAFTPYDPAHPVNRATDAAAAAGISVVFGAGNDGPRSDSVNAFSMHPTAISAAGGRKDGHLAFFSSRGIPGSDLYRPTVTTPGENIVSVRARTGFYGDAADAGAGYANPDAPTPADLPHYATSSGTSMASPHVAGIVALMQEAAHRTRGAWLTAAQVRNVLQNTARSEDPSRPAVGLPNYQGYTMGAGYADAAAAVAAAAAGSHQEPYDDGVTYDVRSFTGTVGAGLLVPTTSFTSNFVVHPGAISLDVMADWGPDRVVPASTDIDLELIDPADGARGSTFMRCNPAGQPNGYSSFCSSAPSERHTVVRPMPGTWTVRVFGSVSAGEAVRGAWSAAYPDGTALSAAPAASTLVLEPATSTGVAGSGQPLDLVATVRDSAGNGIANVPVTWSTAGAGSSEHAEPATDLQGRASAQAASATPGSQTVTARAGGLLVSATLTWLGVAAPDLGPGGASTPGEAAGGGWWESAGRRHHFSVDGSYAAGAPSPGGRLAYDDKAGTVVRGDSVSSFVVAGAKATLKGPASVNGVGGYRFEATVDDRGEPGRDTDVLRLVVTKPADPLFRIDVGGVLRGGNVQVRTA
ncbi:MAG TPA: S8 family serine peptidase [Mycobacteriales bacterium]|nr:S8 family serine peptidase [Mycobacteriales bacterium]